MGVIGNPFVYSPTSCLCYSYCFYQANLLFLSNMPPSAADQDSWFFVSDQALMSKKSLRVKAATEAGVGTVWVPEDADDFVQVSWEDALLPEEQKCSEQQSGESTPVAEKPAAPAPIITPPSLHPVTESPWATMKTNCKPKQISQHKHKHHRKQTKSHLRGIKGC